MKRNRTVAVLLGAVALPLSLGACSGSSGGGGGNLAKDSTFTTVIDEDPGNLHPLVTSLISAQLVDSYAYDTLVFFDPASGKAKPYLATSWKQSPTKIEFALNKDVTCSDGSKFTAQVAADNINWVAKKSNGSPLRDSVVPSDAEATADPATNTLTVTVATPHAFLLNGIGSVPMACANALSDPKSAKAATDGTGLFKLTEAVANDHYTFERRGGYTWGPESKTTSSTVGVPKKVVIRVVKNASTATNLLLSGKVNAAKVSGADAARVGRLKKKSSPSITGEMNFNQMPGKPTADFAVRKALVQAVNLDTWTKVNTGGHGRRAQAMSVHAPPACDYDSVKGNVPAFDLAAAKQTLDGAGWVANADGTRSKGGRPLTIKLFYVNQEGSTSAAAELLQRQWRDLGVKVILHGGDNNFVVSAVLAPKDPSAWDVSVGINMQSNAPNVFVPYLSGEGPPKGTNFSFIDNPTYTRSVGKASSLVGDDICAAYKAAESSLVGQLNVLPIAVTDTYTYFNGATSLYPPGGGGLSGVGVRVLQK